MGRAAQNAIGEQAARKSVWANNSNRSNRKQRFGSSPGRHPQAASSKRFFDRIKQSRGIATRYDRRAETYLAAVKLVGTCIWCPA